MPLSAGSKISIAVNDKHSGKMPSLPDVLMPNWWKWFNGGFRNVLIDPDMLPDIICSGWAITAQHRNFRKASNFVKAQHIGLDFDGCGLLDIVDDFILDNAYMIHTTPSHTEEEPHYRVIFLLTTPVSYSALYSDMSSAITERYPNADQVCRDPARLFFGSENCQYWVFGNMLQTGVAIDMAERYREALPVYEPVEMSDVDYSEYIAYVMESEIERILTAPDGSKHSTLNSVAYLIGGYVGAGLIPYDEAYNLLYSAITSRRIKSASLASRTIETALKSGMERPVTPAPSKMVSCGVLVF